MVVRTPDIIGIQLQIFFLDKFSGLFSKSVWLSRIQRNLSTTYLSNLSQDCYMTIYHIWYMVE